MKDERLLPDDEGDDLLKSAFRSVRDAYDGTNDTSNATLQRALFRTRKQVKKQRVVRWAVLPIAAALVASTAWAGMTGRLAPALASMVELLHPNEKAPPPVAMAPVEVAPPAAVASIEPPPPAPVEAPAPPLVEPPAAVSPTPVAAPPPVVAHAPTSMPTPPPSAKARPVIEPPAVEPARVAEPAPSAPDPHAALFAEAHRLHFIDHDPAGALAAWDRYLAEAPSGRFSPEARYNRALALVRLGRTNEAKAELAAFATGTYGNYRRDDAKKLLDALSR